METKISNLKYELHNSDCLEKMKDLQDKSIDLFFCDLPYGQTACSWDYKIDLNKFWKQVMRIKKSNTPIFFTTTTKFGVDLITSAPKELKFFDLVIIKSAPTGFLLAKKFPLRKHEMVYVFYDKLPFYDLSSHTHKFIKKNQEEDNQIKDEQIKNGDVNENYKGIYGGLDTPVYVSNNIERNKLRRQYKKEGKSESAYDPPLPTSMLEIKSTRGKHSTEKPVALMEWILKYYSKEGDTILDPTMGSGSTGVACKNMNRNFIGIEMDEEIFKVAVERLNLI